MASQWALVDDQFPHFQGDESVPERINALVNYMFVLAEQLRYMLSNLKAENWNSASLQAFSQETSDAAAESVEAQLSGITGEVETLSKQLGILSSAYTQEIGALQVQDAYFEKDLDDQQALTEQLQGDVAELQAADTATREAVSLLDEEVTELQVGLDEETAARETLDQLIGGEGGLTEQVAALTEQLAALAQILQHSKEENTVTLGGEMKEIRIVGKAVYVNDTLIGGTADETA